MKIKTLRKLDGYREFYVCSRCDDVYDQWESPDVTLYPCEGCGDMRWEINILKPVFENRGNFFINEKVFTHFMESVDG